MKFKHVVFMVSVVAIIAAVVGGAKYLGASPEPQAAHIQAKREPGVARFPAGAAQLSFIRSVAIKEVPLPVSEPFNGRIAYDENVTTRVSSPILGRVVAMHAEVGDHVKRGTVLADIDSPDLANTEADWRKAQADEVRKKLAFDRSKTLFSHEVIARKDYESADADLRQAIAETRRAALRMKNLHASGKENGQFGLQAPIAGVIADRQMNPGLEVRPDLPNPLFVITDLNRLWVIADVPERSIGRIKLGQAVNIETDAYPEEHFSAKVDRIGLTLDPNTRRIQVRCTVQNIEGKLRPEMFARVFFLADGEKKGVQIPNTGLIIEGVYHYVFVEKQPGVFEKRRVKVLLKGNDNSFIDEGLAKDEHVVTEGALLLNAEVSADAQ